MILLDTGPVALLCTFCKARETISLPAAIDRFSAEVIAFQIKHAPCKEKAESAAAPKWKDVRL